MAGETLSWAVFGLEVDRCKGCREYDLIRSLLIVVGVFGKLVREIIVAIVSSLVPGFCKVRRVNISRKLKMEIRKKNASKIIRKLIIL